jgi:class 3 adenylate cyclase
MDAPPIQYARTDDGVNIAYFDIGTGSPLVFMPNHPYSHVQMEWQQSSWFEQLAEHCRLIRYDGRGNGLSERTTEDFSVDALRRDLDAVVEAAGVDRFALLGMINASTTAIRYAHDHPERVSTLFLWHPYARASDFFDQPHNEAFAAALRNDFELFTFMAAGMAFGWDDAERMAEWGGHLLSQATTAEVTRRALGALSGENVETLLPGLRSETVVVHCRGNRLMDLEATRRVVAGIPGARLTILEGRGLYPFSGDGDAALGLLREHLEPPAQPLPTAAEDDAAAVRTILFTDLESSTALTQAIGDDKAQDILHGHNDAVRAALSAHDGEEVKHTGDGIMASFGSAVSAVQAAQQIQHDLAGDAIRVRIGLNAGEPIAEDHDYFGTAVQLAARICDRAEPGQVLVANVVRELCAGKALTFTDQGEATLKGFPESVRLYAVEPPAEAN